METPILRTLKFAAWTAIAALAVVSMALALTAFMAFVPFWASIVAFIALVGVSGALWYCPWRDFTGGASDDLVSKGSDDDPAIGSPLSGD